MSEQQRLIFITGQAGSGKSTKCRELTHGCKTILLSTSFFHALAIGGATLNNFLGVGLGLNDLSFYTSNQISVFEKDTIVIIEEVSRLSLKMFHILDRVLGNTFNKQLPFGGVHIALVGDMSQFPIDDPFCDSHLFPLFRIIQLDQKIRRAVVIEISKVVDHHGPRYPEPIPNLFWNNLKLVTSEEPLAKQVFKHDNIMRDKTVYRIQDHAEHGNVRTTCGHSLPLDECQLLPYFIHITSNEIENSSTLASKTWFLEKVNEIHPILDFLCRQISKPFPCWKGQQVRCLVPVGDVKANELGCVIDIGKHFVLVHFDFNNRDRKIPLILLNVYKNGFFSNIEQVNERKVGKIKFMPLACGNELSAKESVGLMFESVVVDGIDQHKSFLCSRGRASIILENEPSLPLARSTKKAQTKVCTLCI